MHRSNHRVLCTIAGFDPTGGAGIGVDRAVFAAFGARARAVVTVETDQGPDGVRRLGARDPAQVAAELRRILAEDDPAALKLGALGTLAIVEAVAAVLAEMPPRPVVFDPVLAASAGGALLEPAAIPHLVGLLGPHVTLLTPNLPEAQQLAARDDLTDQHALARVLCKQGWQAVLVKGGHAEGTDVVVVDVAFAGAGEDDLVWAGAFEPLDGPGIRGTGCALASATAARLGRGDGLGEAIETASHQLQRWMRDAHAAGRTVLPPLRRVEGLLQEESEE